jgi:hypothetical protein
MVIILGQAKNYKPPPYKPPLIILGQNVGEKFKYIYQGKKDGYIWGKTEKLNHPPLPLDKLWGKDLGAKTWGTIFSHMAFFKLGGRGNPTIILTYPPMPFYN